MVALEATRSALADEWTRRSPTTPVEIAAFYRESECLEEDLEAWHETPERQQWTRAIVEIAQNNGVKSALDVGAGIGRDIEALKAIGVMVDAVEPNQSLLKSLARRKVAVAASVDRVVGQFDMVICIDVLEHVPEPEKLLAQIIDKVKVGGLLIEATATHDQSTPLHLPELEGWGVEPYLEPAGFVPVQRINRLTVWQRREIEVMPTVLVVAHREVSVPTVECLFELVGQGWPVAMVYGDALVDRARAKAVSAWFRNETSDVFLMIDDDIVFKTEHAERVVALAREKRSIACAAYPVGDGGHMASRAWPGELLEFGEGYEPRKIRWPATGFMAVHRDVIAAIVETMEPCYPEKPDAFWPMFQPFSLRESPGYEEAGDYLSEDYAFGQRAMDLGFDTWQDQETILFHLKIKALSVLNMPGATVRQRDEQKV